MRPNRREFLLASAAIAGTRLAGTDSPKTRVGLVRSSHKWLTQPSSIEDALDYAKVREMVWAAIEYGKPRAGSLEAKIRPGSWVVLKPNIGNLASQSGYRTGDVTDFRVTKAVLEYVASKSRARRITVAEAGTYRGLQDSGGSHVSQNGASVDGRTFDWGDREFPGWGGTLGGMLRELGAQFPDKQFDYVNFGYDASRDASGAYEYIEVRNTARGVGAFANRSDYCITNTIRNCDFFIDVPVMKVHADSVGITACIKNYVGTAPRQVYAPVGSWANRLLHDFHSVEGRIDPWVVDLASFHPPDFSVVDGIRGLQYTNHNNNKPDQMLRNNLVLAGEDAIAVDSVVARIMSYNPLDMEFLHLAVQREMGTMDPGQIDINGDDPGAVTRRWAKSANWHGRGNREWLVTRDADAPMASWQRYAAPTDNLHLARVAGYAGPGTTYRAAARVRAHGSIKAFLWAGVCGRCSVALNGEQVTEHENASHSRIGQFKVPVELHSGENILSFQVRALEDPPEVSALLVGPRNDGDAVEGIRYS